MGLKALDKRIVAARTALEQSEGRQGRAGAGRAALWHWDLASGRMEWDERLTALFGYAERVTDAAWRETRIHPRDRERVATSLERATIAHPGAVWSEQFRFRQADGSYATVTERAYVVQDDAGPRVVLGAITPTAAGQSRAGPSRSPLGGRTYVPMATAAGRGLARRDRELSDERAERKSRASAGAGRAQGNGSRVRHEGVAREPAALRRQRS